MFFIIIVLVALMAAFIILLIDKIGVLKWIQINGNEFFNNLARCQFCVSFWMNTIISIVAFAITMDYVFLFIPIFSTPITRVFL